MALKRRVVVVGLGSIGRRHTRLLLERDDVSVEVVEPRAEALASVRKELGDVPSHRSFEEMLETTPYVVWVATPTPFTLHNLFQRSTPEPTYSAKSR